jgi:glycosyltransferase involved in cell wall biosynthesis
MTRKRGRRLVFIALPPTMKSGLDCVSVKGAAICRSLGINTEFYEIWPEKYARLFLREKSKVKHLLFKYVVAPIATSLVSRNIQVGDIVWMYDISRYGSLSYYGFEKRLKSQGAKYVFHLHDDWFSVPGWKEAAMDRVKMADLVGGLTPGINESIRKHCPSAKPVLLRGPIDVERLQPCSALASPPKVIWTGNPTNLKEIPGAMNTLAKVYAQSPFAFLVISGSARPQLDLPIPWEWLPYEAGKEAEMISGACAGLAPLQDNSYARCKDVYKVKTYMACGVPTIATGIGNNVKVIQDGKTGYLVNTVQEWQDRLLKLVRYPEFAREMGAAAREDCVRQFSHEAVIPEWIASLEAKFGSLRCR